MRFAGSGFRVPGFGFRIQGCGSRVAGCGLRVPGSGFRVPSSGFRVACLMFRVPGSGFRAPGSGSGFRASGFGCRIQPCRTPSRGGCHARCGRTWPRAPIPPCQREARDNRLRALGAREREGGSLGSTRRKFLVSGSVPGFTELELRVSGCWFRVVHLVAGVMHGVEERGPVLELLPATERESSSLTTCWSESTLPS